MKIHRTSHVNIFNHSGAKIGTLSLILLIIFCITVLNTSQLHESLNNSTQEYLNDVTTRIASDIRDTIDHKMEDLELISDSISQIKEYEDEEALIDFLNRKAQILEFESLILVEGQGQYAISDFDRYFSEFAGPDNLLSLPSVKSSFQGESCVSYLGGKNIFYSAPVYKDDEVHSVVIGVRKKENMQAMIASKSFAGKGLSCIIDKDGQVVISPTDLKPFLQLDDIFNEDDDMNDASGIHQMLEDMSIGRDGMLEFTSVKKDKLVLAYNSLGINDWVLLTIIPADIITGSADRYVFYSFIVIGITVSIFLLLLFTIYSFYSTHRKQLEVIAFSDELTGGMNNSAFQLKYRELSQGMVPSTYSIVLFNVRDFKLINENFGIDTGNDVLRYIYQVIDRHICREENEFVARSESDNFFLCLKENDPKTICMRLNEIIEDVNSFRDFQLTEYHFSFKLGACIVDNPNEEIRLLQDHARTACQNNDLTIHQDCVFYDERFTERMKKERELNELFESSVSEHRFHVYLQPKVGLELGTLEGAEALIRWNHPQKGVISPSDFIPLFERNGKICRLDLYIFEEVCALIDRWNQNGKKLIPISVNLSRQHFHNSDFLKPFDEIARKYNVPRGIIEFELTEATFFEAEQIDVVKEHISKMHELGFLCSLDDFGSGFSSLGLLKEFEVDTIKLDRSFFVNMSSIKAKDVIACLIELSKKLHVRTVAEGIETAEQLNYLYYVKCDMVQGYIYSKPLPISDFEVWAENLKTNVISLLGKALTPRADEKDG